jgi:hypothetical protein
VESFDLDAALAEAEAQPSPSPATCGSWASTVCSVETAQTSRTLFIKPIEFHTRPGDICYEPFSGSGTQIIAAERTGRICYAMEMEPRYCDVARARWEAFSGESATRA